MAKKRTKKRRPTQTSARSRPSTGTPDLVAQTRALAHQQGFQLTTDRAVPAKRNQAAVDLEADDSAGGKAPADATAGRVEPRPGGRTQDGGGGRATGDPTPSRDDRPAVAVPSGCFDDLPSSYVGLGASYTLDSASRGTGRLMIRFDGRREGGGSDPKDRFAQIEEVEPVPAGGGEVSITTKAVDLNSGRWRVTATPLTERSGRVSPRRDLPVRRFDVQTTVAGFVRAPGVYPYAWPVLVLLGVIVALVAQALLVRRAGIGSAGALTVSAIAVVVGYLVAKAWYMVLHRQGPAKFVTAGTCIQGFLLGAFGTLAAGSLVIGTDVPVLLDATTPGVFFAMTLGRPGCFLGGCCAGRLTGSRWGLWSSDRRVGARRIPVQLIEALIALTIGIVSLVAFLAGPLPLPGALFVGAGALYTVARQLLFPLRLEPRRTGHGRQLTLALAALVALAALAASILAAS